MNENKEEIVQNKLSNGTIININNTINVDNTKSKDKNININILSNNTSNSNNIPSLEHLSNFDEKNNGFKYFLNKIYEKLDIFKYCSDIIQNEGVGVLFNGMSSSILGAVVQNGVYFCVIKIFSYLFKQFNLKLNNGILRSMLINFLSAIFTTLVTNPIWVLNIRMAKKSKEVL